MKESKEFPKWYEIPGYSKYLANKKGYILTKKTGNSTKGGKAGRYLKVKVYPDNSSKTKMVGVHVLICMAFKGKPKEGQVVMHLDDDRENNNYKNLEWGTQSENIQSAHDKGLIKYKGKMQSFNW